MCNQAVTTSSDYGAYPNALSYVRGSNHPWLSSGYAHWLTIPKVTLKPWVVTSNHLYIGYCYWLLPYLGRMRLAK